MRGILYPLHRYIISLTLSNASGKSGTLDQFAARLLRLREERGLTRSEVAAKMGPGITPDQIRFWEIARSNPTLSDLAKLGAHYGVSVHWLLTGAGPVDADHLVLGEADRPPRDMLEKRLLDWATEGRIGSRAAMQAFMIAAHREDQAWQAIQSLRKSLSEQTLAKADREQMRQMVAMMASNAGIDPDRPPINDTVRQALREFQREMSSLAMRAATGPDDITLVGAPVQREGHVEQVVRTYRRAEAPEPRTTKKKKRGA